MKKICLISLGLILLLNGCGNYNSNSASTMKVYKYQKNDIIKTLDVEGTIESSEKENVILTDLLDCKIKSINVEIGDKVKKGDVLCEFDMTEIENEISVLEKKISNSNQLSAFENEHNNLELDKAKKNGDESLVNVQDNINTLQANLENQINQYNDYINNYNGFIAQAEECKINSENTDNEDEIKDWYQRYYENMQQAASMLAKSEDMEMQYKKTEDQIRLYENSYLSTKQEVEKKISDAQYIADKYPLEDSGLYDDVLKLEELRALSDQKCVISEGDGIVSDIYAEIGKKCVNGAVMAIQSNSQLCAHVVIDEKDMLDIKKGMDAVITTSAREGEEYEGTVDHIIDIKKEQGFDCYINIKDITDFRIGMNTKVEVIINKTPDILSVKDSSVFKNQNDVDCVLKAEKQEDGSYKAVEVEVETGEKDNTYIAVSGEGLNEGDFIVLTPLKCQNGQKIEIVEADKNSDEN